MSDDPPGTFSARVEQLPGETRGTLVERGEVIHAPVGLAPADGALRVPAAQLSTGDARGTGALGTVPGKVESLQAKRAAALARVDDRIRRRATSIVDSALRAPDLAGLPEAALKGNLVPGEPAPPGWTKKQLRVALDATNSMKSAPAYLAMAQRVVESYKKAEADRPQAPTINAEVVQVHVSVANYPRRRLSEE
jgi:hypothetical protein